MEPAGLVAARLRCDGPREFGKIGRLCDAARDGKSAEHEAEGISSLGAEIATRIHDAAERDLIAPVAPRGLAQRRE